MYCETCHLDHKKPEFIFHYTEISSHMDHKFVSLNLFKTGKLTTLIETKKTQLKSLQKDLAKIGSYIRKQYDEV